MSDKRFIHVSEAGEISPLATAEEAIAARNRGGYVWLDFSDPTREELTALAEPFGLHPLAIEDCLDEDQVPKLDDFPKNTFLLVNRYRFTDHALTVEEVNFFLGKDFLVTCAAHGEDPADHRELDEAMQLDSGNVGKGPDYLLHVILDHIVDGKLEAIEALQDDLDAAEEESLQKGPAAFSPAGLLRMRRSLLALRKSLFHEREVLMKICRKDSPFISETAIYHFRDIYDHLVKFVEVIEVCREMIATLMEMHLSLVNNELALLGNRTNQVVRRLTFITTVFMPLSFLAGVGGMSEWSMMTGPENWRFSYPIFMGIMVVIGIGSYHVLKLLDRRTGERAGRGDSEGDAP